MKPRLLSLVILALASALSVFGQPNGPFTLTVVPSKSRHSGGSVAMSLHTRMSRDIGNDFYVVLTNVTGEPQAVWEDWNSWGYQTIRFEFTTTDGRKTVVSKRTQGFTRNGPSTFLIQPGEHQVYSIWLDNEWEAQPAFPKQDETSISLKAIYEVDPTPEATQQKVWTGRVESKAYTFKLRQ